MLTVKRREMLHDTVQVPEGTVTPGTYMSFFRDLENKNLIDTSMSCARRLLSGTTLLVDTVAVRLPATIGDVVVNELDRIKVLEEGFLRLWCNNMLVVQGPLWLFVEPEPVPVTGMLRRLWRWLTWRWQKSVPVTGRRLLLPLYLTSNHDIRGELTFDSRTWLLPIGSHRLTLDGPVLVQLCLHGNSNDVC